jgi:hypothetical protein
VAVSGIERGILVPPAKLPGLNLERHIIHASILAWPFQLVGFATQFVL